MGLDSGLLRLPCYQNHRLTNDAVALYYISDHTPALNFPEEAIHSLLILSVAALTRFIPSCKTPET